VTKRVHEESVRYEARSRYIFADGRTQTLSEWEEESGNDKTLIWHRIDMGWEPYRAIFEPPRKYAKRGKAKKTKAG
jgi:hypothetical protein